MPETKENLVSVSQFCLVNNVSIEFFFYCFLIKDLFTGEIKERDQIERDLYLLTSHLQSSASSARSFHSVHASGSFWYQRLGHSTYKVFRHVLSRFDLPVSAVDKIV